MHCNWSYSYNQDLTRAERLFLRQKNHCNNPEDKKGIILKLSRGIKFVRQQSNHFLNLFLYEYFCIDEKPQLRVHPRGELAANIMCMCVMFCILT